VKTKLSEISKAAKLAKALVPNSDINSDGAIRAGDISKISAKSKTKAMDAYVGLLDQLRRTAARDGGPTTANVRKAVDTAVKKLKERDKDGSGALEDSEQVKSMTALETRMIQFASTAKGKSASNFKLPEKYVAKPPPFSWKGSSAEVAVSLLNAYSKPSNDNFWPVYMGPGEPRASRFVINGSEARTMVAALKKLYLSRQKAVMTELAARSQASAYGCVSPTNAGKKVFEAYAEELGLDLDFKQPAAPAYHHSSGRLLRVSATEALFPDAIVVGDPLRDDSEASHIERYWIESARAEKASVPSFLRMARELEMLGAPSSLQRAAIESAMEEARHTGICLNQADSARGRVWSIDELDGAPRIIDLETLAQEAWLDGCLGEAQAAEALAASAELVRSPGLRRAIQSIAHDERKHAELAWAVLDWALREGGPSIRDLIAEKLDSAEENDLAGEQAAWGADHSAVDRDELTAGGVPTSETLRETAQRVEESAQKRLVTLLDTATPKN
jgi:hypothetical protein